MIYVHKTHTIELFDSIHSLKVLRFQRFNKYQMIASEIGNTFEDYDQRTSKVLAFLQKNMVSEAIQELENRRQTVYNAYNEFTPKGKSFAVLVKKIDDVVYDDFSPDTLDRCLEHLDRIGVTYETLLLKLSEVKKNWKRNWSFIIRRFFRRMVEKISRRYASKGLE